jgi:copper transport protein
MVRRAPRIGVAARAARAAVVAVAALALAAPAAHAHALLESTVPERGAAVEPAPGQVVMRFSEPVEIAFGAIRVFDAEGDQVQTGEPFHPGGKGDEVAIRLRPGLPRGGYTATYRVVSADSHPVSGGFVFSVGTEAAATGASVGDLLGDQKSGPVTSVAFGAVRATQFAAIALGIGVLAVLLLAWLPGLRATAGAGEDWRAAAAAFAGRARMLLVVAALVGAAAALAALPLQAATAQGTSVWSALDGTGDVLETRFGVVWGAGALVWLAVLALAAAQPSAPRCRAPAPGRCCSPRRCWRSRCCPGSAAMRGSRSPSPSCCRPTSSTCSPPAPGSADSPCSSSRCRPPRGGWSRRTARACWRRRSRASRRPR